MSLHLENPNQVTIAKLNHSKDEKLLEKLYEVDELSFSVPYYIEIDNEIVRNPHIDIIKEKYIISTKFKGRTRKFIIDSIKKVAGSTEELQVNCFSLEYQLSKRLMIEYERIGANCEMVLSDILRGTGWKIDYINPQFNLKYHYFEFNSQTKLNAIYEVRDKYEAVTIFDTVNKTVSFYTKDEYLKYKGFNIGYGNYIQNIEEDINSDEVVTRLHVYGSDDLTINSVNPTGQTYIDNFSYFLYPFEMDENENVISHSEFMNDDLAKALVRYNKFVSEKNGEFYNYLTQKREIQEQITQEKTRLFELETELQIILDAISLAKQRGDSTSSLNKQRDSKNAEIQNKKNNIKNLELQVQNIDSEIQELHNIIKIESHLTEKQLEELENFIHEEEWTDDNQFDPNDLYEAGVNHLKEINSPPIHISTSLVNFFRMLDEKHNWDRFDVGDIIKIKHDRLGIDIKIPITEIHYEFKSDSINVVISNSKRKFSDSDLYEKIEEQFYTNKKFVTDYNKRKPNWNKIAYNFNLRNDRFEEIPVNPMNTTITHKENDNGSVNLILNWEYPSFNETNKKEHNIDGFLIYLYSDETDEPYQFGSKMGQETIISDIPYDRRTYSIHSLPSNLYYTVGIRSYRRVDEDISLDGILLSEIIVFKPEESNKIQIFSLLNTNNSMNNEPSYLTPPYQPSDEINFKGRINGAKFSVSENEPSNPITNDIWIDSKTFKLWVWDGREWSGDIEFSEIRDKLSQNENLVSELEKWLKAELDEAEKVIEETKSQLEQELKWLEEEVMIDVKRAVEESGITQSYGEPDDIPLNGLYLDTSQEPPRMMRWSDDAGKYIPLFLNEQEIKELMKEIREEAVVESKRYSKMDVLKARKQITDRLENEIENLKNEIEKDFGNVSEIIKDMERLSQELNDLAENLQSEIGEFEGRIIEVEQNVDEINGIIENTITDLERIDGAVTQQQSIIEQHSDLIASKVDNLTYQEDKQGIIESIEHNATAIEQTSESINLKADKDYVDNINRNVIEQGAQLNIHADLIESKVDKTEYNELENIVSSHSSHIEQTDNVIRQTVGRVTSTEEKLEVAETKIEQHAELIALSATKREVELIEGQIDSISEEVASLEIRTDEIFSSVGRIEADIDGRINESLSTISQDLDGVTTSVSNISADLNIAKQDISRVEQTANGIVSTVESIQTDISSLEGDMSTVKTQITQLPDEISLMVQEGIAEIEIGGRNLILNSNNIKLNSSDQNNRNLTILKIDDNGKEYFSVTPINNGNIYNSGGIYFSEPRYEGEEYTLSFEVMTEQSEAWGFYFYTDDPRNFYPIDSTNGMWIRYSVTFTQSETKNDNILFGFRNLEAGKEIGWRNLKLEKGNKATDWSPAPEDQVNKTNVLSSINLSTEGIKIQAPKIDIQGIVSFINSDGSTGTLIDGSRLITGSITAEQLNVDQIFGNSAVVTKIQSDIVKTTQLNAEQITTGILSADRIGAQSITANKLNVAEIFSDSAVILNIQARSVLTANLDASQIRTGTLDASRISIANDKVVINQDGVRVKEANFLTEDSQSGMVSKIEPMTNLIRDHSFELITSTGNMLSDGYYNIGSSPIWHLVGKPRCTNPYDGTDDAPIAPFGDQSLLVNSTNYIIDGESSWYMAPNETYTLSAYFHRPHGYGTGTPQFRIRLWKDNSVLYTSTSNFSPVPSNYSLIRYSHTFTLPNIVWENPITWVDIEIKSTNSTWVVVDGVQLVRGTYPTVYDAEDSLWRIAKGYIGLNTLTVDSGIIYGQRDNFIELTYDNTSNFLRSHAVYERTYTSTSQMIRVTVNGVLGRSTSSRRYKLLEEPVTLDYAKNILKLDAKSWFDKRACEDYARTLSTGAETEEQEIKRIGGLIAEDVHDVGLEMFVSYDDQGRPDGLSNNLWVLLLPILKEHEGKIQQLTQENEQLSLRVTQLENQLNGLM